MSKLLVIKTGTTMADLREQRGDFEQWIIDAMGMANHEVIVVDVSQGEELPEYHQINGVAITGSHAMVTEHRDWSEYTAEWLQIVAEKQIPTIGICYGHQLLAYALGGKVDFNPKGREVGTIAVTLQPAAQTDPLFRGLPDTIAVQLSHRQAVLELPEQVEWLASSAMAENQAFRYGEVVWGTQFHPEFDRHITQAYTEYAREGLQAEGFNADEIYHSIQETPIGLEIMQRFAAIVR
ncbi:glutamine amidotransferase [Alkalinema sp. FACHB-956]|uniref:glutamine amidotransferase n=1 Tax=Alkalinema sp. FACHB-956 TaxID=2692768 RepID=UPI001682D38B|nr:glutamine amidotransferase [Alkalinema sp. FACHB-956]MBD2328327.1 glutamine amidotransferase [Alkalinema sp. FACHB-956]